jgi:DNA repair protein RadC
VTRPFTQLPSPKATRGYLSLKLGTLEREVFRAGSQNRPRPTSITQHLKVPLGLVDIRILDHIIVAGGDTVSFAKKGLL